MNIIQEESENEKNSIKKTSKIQEENELFENQRTISAIRKSLRLLERYSNI